jgi:hypothetical protein
VFFTSFLFIFCLASVSSGISPEDVLLVAEGSQAGSKEPQPLEAPAPSPFSIGWDVTLASKYLFHGVDYSNEKAVIQPEIVATYQAISAIVWTNYDLDTDEFNEIDLYLQYDGEFGPLGFTLGYAYYDYPNRDGWDPTQEVYTALSVDILLQPSAGVHYDFDAGEGLYATFGVSHGMEFLAGTLTLGSTLFYWDHYYEVSGIPSAEFNGTVEYPLGPLTVAPSVSYFLTWDNGDFPEACECLVSDTWLFSINVSRSF